MLAKRAAVLMLSTALIAPTVLTGCTTRSGVVYKPGEAGAVMEVSRATVVHSRKVVIEGLKGNQAAGWGTLVGATVAGAGAYGLTKSDTPLGTAVTIIAAVGGALAGTVLEEQKNRHPGAEYILHPATGKDFAVVQVLSDGEKVLPAGTPIAVLHGQDGFVRVVPEREVPPAK